MKQKKIIAAALAVTCIMGAGSCGGSGSRTETTTAAETTASTTPAATLNEEDKQAVAEIIEEDVEKLANPTVKFLSSWDINPVEGKTKGVALEMFEQTYGGNIEWVQTTWDGRYDKLATYVAAGDSPDMFSAEDLDVFPKGAIKGMFQPLDKYIDFSSDLWAPMAAVNDKFAYDGKHYVASHNTDAGVVMIYNKKTIEENGLQDPAKLVAEDNWTWDTFYDMMLQFCDRSKEQFAIDGWWFEGAFSLTSGVPYIGMKDGNIVQNLDDPQIDKVQEFMLKIKNEDLPLPKSEYGWTVTPSKVRDGKTLFYPEGIYALEDANRIVEFGEPDEIMFVPMPRCPSADAYYLPSAVYGFSLIAGAHNPEGVAAYLDCCIRCRDSEVAADIFKKQLYEDYGWTDEMYDMLLKTRELTAAHPMIEFYNAVNDNVADLINNPMKESYNAGVAWSQTKEEIKMAVQAELDAANAELHK